MQGDGGEDDRVARGRRLYRTVTGKPGELLRSALEGVAPALVEQMTAYGFGDVYAGPALTPQQRQLVILSTLAAQGGAELQLRVHVGAALDLGLAPAEVMEVFVQLAVYAGFPRAINAVLAAKEVLAARGLVPGPPEPPTR